MKKFIVVAGSPESGKTTSILLAHQKLLKNGYVQIANSQKNMIVMQDGNKKVLLVPNGDYERQLKPVFANINYNDYYAIVCSSHATKGKQVFNYMHNLVGQFNLNETEIIPIYKNLLCNHNKNDQENEMVAEFIYKLI